MSLPQNNPPVSNDFLCGGLDTYSISQAVIAPGTELRLPPQNGLILPPVYGTGRVTVVSFFQGWTSSSINEAIDSSYPPVYAGIGVANPSEYDIPMRPLVGFLYPSIWPIFQLGTFCFHRIDAITLVDGDFRSWTMNSNPQNPPPITRKDWPSLVAGITNNTKDDVVFNDVSFGAFVTRG